MCPMGGTAPGQHRLLLVLGLVAGLGLACGASKADRQALLESRREAEFARLNGQVGMVTPSYVHPKKAVQPPIHP